MFRRYRHIHFVGIGGIGMSGIAEVLVTLGFTVSGSDLKRSSTLARLRKRGARVFIGHKPEHLGGAQVVVTSSAVSLDNPEVLAARDKHIPIVPRAEMLAELMRVKYGIAVAGTHGKTTTTSLIGAILYEAGLDPTLIIGGRVNSLRSNARLGKGEFLVAEADESDRSFLKLAPTVAVITNIDPEHMENYRDFEEMKNHFVNFANKVPFYGSVIACADHPVVRSIFPGITRPMLTYGLHYPADLTGHDLRYDGCTTFFRADFRGKDLGRFVVGQPGEHQVSNALAAIATAQALDIPTGKVKNALKKFRGISRRFEILRKADPVVIDDYAHHPVEIAATLQGARSAFPHHEIALVCQPHRYSRLQFLWRDFQSVLKTANRCFITEVYPAGEKPIPEVTGEKLAQEIDGAVFLPTPEEAVAALKHWVGPQKVVLFVGAGSITRVARDFAKRMT